MNQILIIRNLNALMKGEKSILRMDGDGYVTPDWMLKKGMYVCHTCGSIESIDGVRYSGCNSDKFVFTQSNKDRNNPSDELPVIPVKEYTVPDEPKLRPTPSKVKRPSVRRLNRKEILDRQTGCVYRSIRHAAEFNGLSYGKLYREVNRNSNQKFTFK